MGKTFRDIQQFHSKKNSKNISKLVESKPVESKPVESKPVESKLVESKPVESKPVESKPVESKPVESKHNSKNVNSHNRMSCRTSISRDIHNLSDDCPSFSNVSLKKHQNVKTNQCFSPSDKSLIKRTFYHNTRLTDKERFTMCIETEQCEFNEQNIHYDIFYRRQSSDFSYMSDTFYIGYDYGRGFKYCYDVGGYECYACNPHGKFGDLDDYY
jgi:hypothetical protein